jgi:hypothetical protein
MVRRSSAADDGVAGGHPAVAVPDGTEEEWIVCLQEHDCIREARRMYWCPM